MSWEIYLKEKGMRVTAGRISILNIIESSDKGLSAENIYYQCKKHNENLNLSTIYRTLELLEEKDIRKKINIDEPGFLLVIQLIILYSYPPEKFHNKYLSKLGIEYSKNL